MGIREANAEKAADRIRRLAEGDPCGFEAEINYSEPRGAEGGKNSLSMAEEYLCRSGSSSPKDPELEIVIQLKGEESIGRISKIIEKRIMKIHKRYPYAKIRIEVLG